jgi:hypothetical protein
MFLYFMVSVVVGIGIAVIWAGIADESKARQTEGTRQGQPEDGTNQNLPGKRLPQFAKPSAADSRPTINGSPYTTEAKGTGHRAA